MKHCYTALLVIFALGFCGTAVAQNNLYGKILYRISAGGLGTPAAANDTSTVAWQYDYYQHPCAYVDTNIYGDKVYDLRGGGTITYSSSVPAYVPSIVFTTERSVDFKKSSTMDLAYNFPVTAGQIVEVRLYFAEIYQDLVGQRIFDILLEGKTAYQNLNIEQEAGGKDIAIMKSFVVQTGSDGMLNVYFKRRSEYPKVSAIEIIETDQPAVINGIFTAKSSNSNIAAFPNPFSNHVKVSLGAAKAESVRLFDTYGKEFPVTYNALSSELDVEVADYPKGVYFLQVATSDASTETVRLVKE